MYSGSRRYRGVRYVTQYVPIDTSSGSTPSTNIQSDKTVTITSNGTTTIQPDSGYDALSQVSVTTNVPSSPSPITIKYVTNSLSSSPAAENIIPLSSFTSYSYSTTIELPANRVLIQYQSSSKRFGIMVNSSSNSMAISLENTGYYYIISYENVYIWLLDENYQRILRLGDNTYTDSEPTFITLNTSVISPDFSS